VSPGCSLCSGTRSTTLRGEFTVPSAAPLPFSVSYWMFWPAFWPAGQNRATAAPASTTNTAPSRMADGERRRLDGDCALMSRFGQVLACPSRPRDGDVNDLTDLAAGGAIA